MSVLARALSCFFGADTEIRAIYTTDKATFTDHKTTISVDLTDETRRIPGVYIMSITTEDDINIVFFDQAPIADKKHGTEGWTLP